MASRPDTRSTLNVLSNENADSINQVALPGKQHKAQPVMVTKPRTRSAVAAASTSSATLGARNVSKASTAVPVPAVAHTTSRPTKATTVRADKTRNVATSKVASASSVTGVKRTAARQPKYMTESEVQLANEHQAKVVTGPSRTTTQGNEHVPRNDIVPSKSRKIDGATSVKDSPCSTIKDQDTEVVEEKPEVKEDSSRTRRIKLVKKVQDEPKFKNEDPIVAEDPVTGKMKYIMNLDEEDMDDPAMCSAYAQEIIDYLTDREKNFMPIPIYIKGQGDLKWGMRSVLVDWLCEVHKKFEFLPETLFLAISIMDRFLSVRRCEVSKFQLVGLTCLFIAAKLEEVISPQVSNLVYMADNGFKDSEMLAAERYIMRTLNFDIWSPGPFSFIRRISKADDYDLHNRNLAKFLVEAALLDHRFLEFPMSKIAAGAFYLARYANAFPLSKTTMMPSEEPIVDDPAQLEWGPRFVHASGYTAEDIEPVVVLLADVFCSKLRNEGAEWSFFRSKLESTKRLRDLPLRVKQLIKYLGLEKSMSTTVKHYVARERLSAEAAGNPELLNLPLAELD